MGRTVFVNTLPKFGEGSAKPVKIRTFPAIESRFSTLNQSWVRKAAIPFTMLTFIKEMPPMISRAGHTLQGILLVILTSFHLNAQSFQPRYNFRHLNVQNGLTENIVYHFLQDSRGYIWIGTHNGLTLYDGIKTINFLHSGEDTSSLSGNFITGIVEDAEQQVWIGNETGIDRYNRADNTFSHFGVTGREEKKRRPIVFHWVLFLQPFCGSSIRKQDQYGH